MQDLESEIRKEQPHGADSPYPRVIPQLIDASFAKPEWLYIKAKAALKGVSVMAIGGLIIFASKSDAGVILGTLILFVGLFLFGKASKRSSPAEGREGIMHSKPNPYHEAMVQFGYPKYGIALCSEGRDSIRPQDGYVVARGFWDQLNERQRLALLCGHSICVQHSGRATLWLMLAIAVSLLFALVNYWLLVGSATVIVVTANVFTRRRRMAIRSALDAVGLLLEYDQVRQLDKEVNRQVPWFLRIARTFL